MTLNAVEVRVLGCLLEKQRTTPDQYPLSLNSLRLAANQTTSRDPVTDYDEAAIRKALETLRDRGWTRLPYAAGPASVPRPRGTGHRARTGRRRAATAAQLARIRSRYPAYDRPSARRARPACTGGALRRRVPRRAAPAWRLRRRRRLLRHLRV